MRIVGGDGNLALQKKRKFFIRKPHAAYSNNRALLMQIKMDDPLNFDAKMGSDLG